MGDGEKYTPSPKAVLIEGLKTLNWGAETPFYLDRESAFVNYFSWNSEYILTYYIPVILEN